MSIVGDFRVPAESFAIDHTLSVGSGVTVKADRMASHSPREVLPFLWATGGDVEAFADALTADPSVESVSVADELDGEVLLRVQWHEEFQELIHEMIDHHATILEATATGDHWNLRLRFAEEDMVSSFQDHFRDRGREFEVRSLQHPTEPRQRQYGLTREQHEALVAAVREGYFTIPRNASLEDVGRTLGISPNATSQRIRRGCQTLVRSSLLTDGGNVD